MSSQITPVLLLLAFVSSCSVAGNSADLRSTSAERSHGLQITGVSVQIDGGAIDVLMYDSRTRDWQVRGVMFVHPRNTERTEIWGVVRGEEGPISFPLSRPHVLRRIRFWRSADLPPENSAQDLRDWMHEYVKAKNGGVAQTLDYYTVTAVPRPEGEPGPYRTFEIHAKPGPPFDKTAKGDLRPMGYWAVREFTGNDRRNRTFEESAVTRSWVAFPFGAHSRIDMRCTNAGSGGGAVSENTARNWVEVQAKASEFSRLYIRVTGPIDREDRPAGEVPGEVEECTREIGFPNDSENLTGAPWTPTWP